MSKQMKLLWVGDAVTQTGFARVTHSVLSELLASGKWDIRVIGINYNGDPHGYPDLANKIFPAVIGGDVWGIGRIKQVTGFFRPDVICVLNDPWNVPHYLEELAGNGPPVVAYLPVDSPNQMAARSLNGLSRAIAYTNFGRKELLLGGYQGRTEVIPHGVNSEIYRMGDQREARIKLKLHQKLGADAFIFGNINRNQPRKRLDLTIQYFAQWWINEGLPPNAYLYLHSCNQDIGWNLTQLARYFGIERQLILTNPNMRPEHMLNERDLPTVYHALDVQISTTLGEGWGLTQHEGMACGIPQIVPRYSALAEWPGDAVRHVKIGSYAVTTNGINTVGGVPDMDDFCAAMSELYHSPERRIALSKAGFERATDPAFKWSNVALQFDRVLSEAATEMRSTPVGLQEAHA